MLKLIKADLYKLYRRPYLYVLTGGLLLTAAFFLYFLVSASALREEAFTVSYRFLFLPLFLVAMLVEITIVEDIKYGTLKNTISVGISRTQLYLSKLITAGILCVISALIVFTFFVGCGYLFLEPGEGFTNAFMAEFVAKTGVAVLLYLGAIALGALLAVLLQRSSASSVFTFVFVGSLLIPTLIATVLCSYYPAFSTAAQSLLFIQCYNLPMMQPSHFSAAILVALLHIMIFGALGAVVLKRQEIR